jgi:hypothetical protein
MILVRGQERLDEKGRESFIHRERCVYCPPALVYHYGRAGPPHTSINFVVFRNSLDGRRGPANLQTALVTWYASASE